MKRGLPTVVVTTERFGKLARTVMHAQRVPESINVEIPGNPEFVGDAELAVIADRVIEQAVERLTREHAGG